MKLRIPFLFLITLTQGIYAKLEVASVFTDNMVLQRDQELTIWGWDTPGEQVMVSIGANKNFTTVNTEGKWEVTLPSMPVNKTPQELLIKGTETLTLKNILFGDVWLCGGQSNMQWALQGTDDIKNVIDTANYPQIRLFQVPKKVSLKPQDKVKAKWFASNPKVISKFTAVGFLFGRRLHLETELPIGLIMCAVGSTSVECWVSKEALKTPLFKPSLKTWKMVQENWSDPKIQKKYKHKNVKNDPSMTPDQSRTFPGGCYNAMLHPLFPNTIKGII